MFEKIVRKNIRELQAYSCARNEYSGEAAMLLDANENPYDNGYNRYPDPYQSELKTEIALLKGVAAEQILLGNGSDEIIDMLIRTVCEPAQDHIIVFSPGYSMYEVCADINDVGIRKIDLTADFLPDWERVEELRDEHTKIIFLCTPNNPTGRVIPLEQIENICRCFNGLVLVDEAYIDFAAETSAVKKMGNYPNMVVLQTLSKAWGMAGLRLGICFAHPELIAILNKVKPPYNIGSLTQQTAMKMLQCYDEFVTRLERIKYQRQRLLVAFREIGIFEKVYDSDANFILVTLSDCRRLYHYLLRHKIVVRLRDIPPLIAGGIRITVGTEEENDRLLYLLESYKI